MSGRILIIDSVATNRIVLRAKILAARYDVQTSASCRDARDLVADTPPDLILINLNDPSEDRHGFCRSIRSAPETAGIPIVSIGVADTARARFAAIDAGADDVLPRPMSDTLLLARMRSLLRRTNAAHDLNLRDGTRQALGFEEESAPRLTPARISVVSDTPLAGPRLVADLQAGMSQSVRMMTPQASQTAIGPQAAPDVLVIDGTGPETCEDTLYALISDLATQPDSRTALQLVMVPDDRPDMAAMALDLGAQDVVFTTISAAELTLRTQTLVALKTRQDTLRDRVRNGLQAAVTDPLTGLYNRRYAETHLRRIADQSRETGRDFAVMVFDIDHFKAVNDTHGHAVGDLVLTELADRLGKGLRGVDLLARIGGEEFLIAMPGTGLEQAQIAAERLRKMIQARAFGDGDTGRKLRLTVSVGVSVGLADGSDPQTPAELIDQADVALYDAKASGRNTIRVSRVAA